MSFEFAIIIAVVAVLIAALQFLVLGKHQPAGRSIGTNDTPFSKEAGQIVAVCLLAFVIGIFGKTSIDWLARPGHNQLEARLEFERAVGDLRNMRAEVAEIRADSLEAQKTDPSEQANVEQCANLRAKQLSLKSDLAELRANPSAAVGHISTIQAQLSALEKQFQTAEAACSRLGRSKFFTPFSTITSGLK